MNTIRHIRTNVLAMTQAELGRIAGVKQATVSRWERDLNQPSLHHLKRIRTEARNRRVPWDDRWFFVAADAEQKAATA